jgi:hypothetical protein
MTFSDTDLAETHRLAEAVIRDTEHAQWDRSSRSFLMFHSWMTPHRVLALLDRLDCSESAHKFCLLASPGDPTGARRGMVETELLRTKERLADYRSRYERALADLHGCQDGAALRDERVRRQDAEQQERNLLARIHRDGGHYTDQHGIEASRDEAHRLLAAWIAEHDELPRLRARLEVAEAVAKAARPRHQTVAFAEWLRDLDAARQRWERMKG